MSNEREVKGQQPDSGQKWQVSANTSLDNLPLYQQAAEQTGFAVTIVAREGEPFSFDRPIFVFRDGRRTATGQTKPATITMEPGRIGITIRKPSGNGDFSPFWKKFGELRAAVKA